MKISVIKKVETEIDIDVETLAKNLISHNIDCIIDSLIEELMDDPEFYIKGIDINEDTQLSLNSYIKKELDRILSEVSKC